MAITNERAEALEESETAPTSDENDDDYHDDDLLMLGGGDEEEQEVIRDQRSLPLVLWL